MYMPNSFIFLYFVIIFAIFTNNTQGFRLLQASISPLIGMSCQIKLSWLIVLINCSFSAAPRRDFFTIFPLLLSINHLNVIRVTHIHKILTLSIISLLFYLLELILYHFQIYQPFIRLTPTRTNKTLEIKTC